MIVFSTGDILTAGGLGLGVIAYGLRELRAWSKARVDHAVSAAEVSRQLVTAVAERAELKGLFDRLDARQDVHEKECAEFRGKILENYDQHAALAASQGRVLDRISAQISRLGPKAGSFTEVLAPGGD